MLVSEFNRKYKILTQRAISVNDNVVDQNTESTISVHNGVIQLNDVRIGIIRYMNYGIDFNFNEPDHYYTNRIINRESNKEVFMVYTPDKHFIKEYILERFGIEEDFTHESDTHQDTLRVGTV